MKIAVRYYSKGGNTKKIALAIAKAAGVEAKPITEPLSEDVDILFLGTAPYAFDVDDSVKKYIQNISVHVGKAALFSTAAGLKSIRKYVAKYFDEKNIPLDDNEFSCRGSYLMFHKGRPNADDEQNAAQFARKIIS